MASGSWFRLAVADLPDSESEDASADAADGASQSAVRRRYADLFRARKAQADTALELRLAQLVERERAAHAALVDQARCELAKMHSALPKASPVQLPDAPQQQQQQPSQPDLVQSDAAPPEDRNSEATADEAFEMESDEAEAAPQPGVSSDAEPAESEPEAEQLNELARRRPATAASTAAVAHSLPISIQRSAAALAAAAAAAAAAEDMAARAEAASSEDPPLPDAAEFKGMTDAERLYVMQAVSYRYTASVREHDQFGNRGPPYLRQLAEKARDSRREQRRSSLGRRGRGLSATDELLEVEEAAADAAAGAAVASGDPEESAAAIAVVADEDDFPAPQPRVLRANTISVDMSRAFKKL